MTSYSGSARVGKIVTFYSYKGGTGRSMALANVAWVLASSGIRVLAIDWDLEAPGLHRYFEPMLGDKTLEASNGIIDFVRDFATAAVAQRPTATPEWYEHYGQLLTHAVPLDWNFSTGGLLHFVPAGRQDAAYPVRVNSFDWQTFYERLGGGVLLETVKQNLRTLYDIILIDSRTGVSDTSGVCTIQMPDELVVCFTLNRQSIYGASAAARSAYKQRHTKSGEPTLKVWPVPTRVEINERDRLELASTIARARFTGLMHHLDPEQEENYWGEIAIGYEPYYAYEEVLASFRDRPRQTGSMLHSAVTLAKYLVRDLGRQETIDQSRRTEVLAAFTSRSARDYEQELIWTGEEYDRMRKRMDAGDARTSLMNQLVGRVQTLGGQQHAGEVAENIFRRDTDGGRIVGLALAVKDPQRQHVDLALSGIAKSRSAFEQYHALRLAQKLLSSLHPSAAAQLRQAIDSQIGKTILESDPTRWVLAHKLLDELQTMVGLERPLETPAAVHNLRGHEQVLVEVRTPTTLIRYVDGDVSHGDWVKTRGVHSLKLPSTIHMSKYLVTNSLYRKFVEEEGYRNDNYWSASRDARSRFLTLDGVSLGPGNWPNSGTIPAGKEDHPVVSVCYFEAQAFVNWCNSISGSSDRKWTLPREDEWEFVARTEAGFVYPWGDTFDPTRCNSSESGIGGTSEVTRFESGASKAGCCDMAGNVWEFVLAADAKPTFSVLRGGSFNNDRFVVRSYLRLSGVPLAHRPGDFGFRLELIHP